MPGRLLFLLTLCVGGLAAPVEEEVSYAGYRLMRVSPVDGQQDAVDGFLRRPEVSGAVSIWSQHANVRTIVNSRQNISAIDLLVAPAIYQDVVEFLEKRNIPYVVLIKDLEEEIHNENPPMDPEEEEWENRGGHRLTWRRYHRYKDIYSYLDYLANTYSDICKIEVIGKSSQGRDLKLLKVSTGGSGKPAIWIDGGLHAREWISPATVTFLLLQLVEFRDQHSELLDSIDWYILPVGNPDGYEYSHLHDRLWRKTRSLTSPRRQGAACYGVDANRNWDIHWGEGSSHDSCREDYAGVRPFSEPETRAMSEYIVARKQDIKVYLTMHSYSQMWLVPWGYKDEKPDDYYDMYVLAEKGVEALEAVRKTDYLLGTAAELMYTSSGGSDDWAKGVAGIKYAYTVELPDTGKHGFVLPASQIEPVGQETWAAIKAIAAHFAEGHN